MFFTKIHDYWLNSVIFNTILWFSLKMLMKAILGQIMPITSNLESALYFAIISNFWNSFQNLRDVLKLGGIFFLSKAHPSFCGEWEFKGRSASWIAHKPWASWRAKGTRGTILENFRNSEFYQIIYHSILIRIKKLLDMAKFWLFINPVLANQGATRYNS